MTVATSQAADVRWYDEVLRKIGVERTHLASELSDPDEVLVRQWSAGKLCELAADCE
jgi:hypothetical protein